VSASDTAQWPVKSLAELGGQVTSGSRGWAEFYADHGSLFVRITNLSRENIHLDLTSSRFVNIDSGNAEAQRTLLAPGDLLVSITADIGIIGYVDNSVPTPAYINQHIARVRLNPRLADSRFVAYYLASWEPQRRFVGATDTGAKAGMNLTTVASLTTVMPPLPEQVRIAEALADVDDQIATLERLIAKKQAIKQGMMQQLLTGRTRLPSFNSEWSGTTVGQVSEFLTGYPFESASFAATGIRLIRGSNVKRGEIDWSREIAKYWANLDPSLRAFALRDGDIVIAMDGALVGRSFARITDAELPAYLVQRVARLRGTTINQDLLYQWIGSRDFAKHVDDVKTHTAIPHISPRDIREFKISIPVDVNEQRAITEVLGDTDLQIELLKFRLTRARNIKTGMMQQLLTGRTRLPVKEAAS
jgi:type I restriction enzyme S subunit